MGSAASASSQLTSIEKIHLTQVLEQKYEYLQKSGSTSNVDDKQLFEALKETYEETNQRLIQKRNDGDGYVLGRANSMLEDDDTNQNEFNLKGSVIYQPFANDIPSKKSNSSQDASGKVVVGQTSSQLVSMQANVINDQERITQFVNQLKSGELQAKSTSQFRVRRLTYSAETVDDTGDIATPALPSMSYEKLSPMKSPASPSPPRRSTRVARTTIFASSEIGVKAEKEAPFPDSILGTYSCHGIEPSYESENGIHEKINQDRGCVVYPYNSRRNEALFMVLDGHGEQGDKVSDFVMRQIVISLEKDPLLDADPVNALKNAFIQTNTALLVTQINYMTSGCTCVTVYVKQNTLYVANAGDSRAVMAYIDSSTSSNNNSNNNNNSLDPSPVAISTGSEGEEFIPYKARDLSRDHKPDDPDEMARILQWGGFVCPPAEEGLSARVYLDPQFTMIGLAMSRSIGDHAVKTVGVIAEPEVQVFELNPAQDQFMIMASDGVWEFITSQEAVNIVQRCLLTGGTHDACQELIETAAARWQEEEGDYRDDITAIIVKFPLPYN